MSRKCQPGVTPQAASAREIADYYGLPFEILAKTLQRLRDTGLIRSAQGARGGYTLGKSMSEVTLVEFLELMEGPQGVVPCCLNFWDEESTEVSPVGSSPCDYKNRCEIKDVMGNLNSRIYRFLGAIRLSEITDVPGRTSEHSSHSAMHTIGSSQYDLSIAGEEP